MIDTAHTTPYNVIARRVMTGAMGTMEWAQATTLFILWWFGSAPIKRKPGPFHQAARE